MYGKGRVVTNCRSLARVGLSECIMFAPIVKEETSLESLHKKSYV